MSKTTAGSGRGKTRRTASVGRSDLFANKTFVLSRNEPDAASLSREIRRCRGIVRKNLSRVKRCNGSELYFVVSWLEEDDGRLGDAADVGATIVTPSFLRTCLREKKFLDFTQFAEGGCSSEKFRSLFLSPCPDEAREREEQPQTFGEFRYFVENHWHRPGKKSWKRRKIIYTLCLLSQGTTRARAASFRREADTMNDFFGAFFGLEVRELPSLRLFREGAGGADSRPMIEMRRVAKRTKKRRRMSSSKHFEPLLSRHYGDGTDEVQRLQLEVIDTIAALKALLPKDGYCLCVLTEEDLYEEAIDVPQVLGRAAGQDFVCVCSTYTLRTASKRTDSAALERLNLLNTAAHEVMHIVALDHCPFYLCTMSAHLEAKMRDGSDGKYTSVCVCPICLRKLAFALGFDVLKRYDALRKFYRSNGWIAQSEWIRKARAAAASGWKYADA